MTTHEWHESGEDGRRSYYRAKHHAGRWTFQSRRTDEEHWTTHDEAPLELLESFREILWNKVQRRRAPEKLLDQIEALIARATQ